MYSKTTANLALGIDIGSSSIKTARISTKNGSIEIKELRETKIESPPNSSSPVKPLYTACQKATKELGQALLISSIPDKTLSIRPLSLQVTAKKDIDAILKYQAEPLLPYPLKEAIIDRIVLESKKNSTSLTILSIQSCKLKQYLEQIHSYGLEPESISCNPKALANFANHLTPSSLPRFVIHMEDTHSLCTLTHKGKILNSHILHLGYTHFIQALAVDRELSFEEAKNLEKKEPNLITEELSTLKKTQEKFDFEVSKTLKSITLKENLQIEKQILFTGNIPLFYVKPKLSTYDLYPITQKQKVFAISIGLALENLTPQTDPINFRQGEFSYPHPLKRMKKKLLAFACLCLTLTVTALITSHLSLKQELKKLTNQYSSISSSLEYPYEKAQKKSNAPSSFPLNKTTLLKNIHLLENNFASFPQSFPLEADVPRVSDFIAWLNQLPPSLDSSQPLQINRLSYKMVSRPQANKTKDPYKVKVEVEFTTPSALLARKFREVLMKPNAFIDSHYEISWNTQGEKYRCSFHLQNHPKGS